MEIGNTDSQAVWLQRMPNQESQGEFVPILHGECLFETKVYAVDFIFMTSMKPWRTFQKSGVDS